MGNIRRQRFAQRLQPLRSEARDRLRDPVVRVFSHPFHAVVETAFFDQISDQVNYRRELAAANLGDFGEGFAFAKQTNRFFGGCDLGYFACGGARASLEASKAAKI